MPGKMAPPPMAEPRRRVPQAHRPAGRASSSRKTSGSRPGKHIETRSCVTPAEEGCRERATPARPGTNRAGFEDTKVIRRRRTLSARTARGGGKAAQRITPLLHPGGATVGVDADWGSPAAPAQTSAADERPAVRAPAAASPPAAMPASTAATHPAPTRADPPARGETRHGPEAEMVAPRAVMLISTRSAHPTPARAYPTARAETRPDPRTGAVVSAGAASIAAVATARCIASVPVAAGAARAVPPIRPDGDRHSKPAAPTNPDSPSNHRGRIRSSHKGCSKGRVLSSRDHVRCSSHRDRRPRRGSHPPRRCAGRAPRIPPRAWSVRAAHCDR